jgi:hypothetical protein
MELFRASKQWASRPDDESFWDLQELYQESKRIHEGSAFATVGIHGIRIIAEGEELLANGQSGTKARMTNYSFSQISRFAGAPAGYLASLPAPLAAECLNAGLAGKEETRLMFHRNGDLVLRCATSPDYQRVWNDELIEALIGLEGQGWRAPPARQVPGRRARAATQADVLRNAGHASLSVKAGDMISPAGLYLSDRDMFVFLVDDSKRIEVRGASLCRGFFLWNSEVGDKSLGIQTFLFDAVCGNHIVWGARDVSELRMSHVGRIGSRWEREITLELRRYANSSTNDEASQIERAQNVQIAGTKDEVIQALFDRKSLGLSKRVLTEAYDVADRTPRYGNPRSPWGMINGLTEVSQSSAHADERTKIDRSAGKILEIAF